MQNIMTAWVLALALLAQSAVADRFYVSINTLYGWCKPYEIGEPSIGSLCEGYLNAIADILSDGTSIHGSRACIPEGVELIEIRDVVLGTIDNAPDTRGMGAHGWVAQAIASAYPCEKTGN
jgi:hypothetical protein